MPHNKTLKNEVWKPVKFNLDFKIKYKLEVSNLGRLKTFSKHAEGNIIKGSMTEGYKIYRTKFLMPRDEAVQKMIDNLEKQIVKISKKINELEQIKHSKKEIATLTELLISTQLKLKNKYAIDAKKRTVYYHALFHRLVATAFLPKPKKGEKFVAHLNHDKLNNKAINLKWMTQSENILHQQKSPAVIERNLYRKEHPESNGASTKLSVPKVMLIKKMLNNNTPVQTLIKQFKVSDMQIYRIKRGENWTNIPAAT